MATLPTCSENMVNKSKGDYADTVLDLNAEPSQEVLDKITAMDTVYRVRLIKA